MTQNNIFKIDIQRPYREIEIGSLIVKLWLDDESLDEFRKISNEIGNKFKDIDDSGFEGTKGLFIELADSLLKETGIGEKIFEECGKSTLIMVNAMLQLKDYAEKAVEETTKLKTEKINKYQKNKNYKKK